MCAECIDTVSKCTRCNTGKFLENNLCNTSCSVGTYGDAILNECTPCNAICTKCTG